MHESGAQREREGFVMVLDYAYLGNSEAPREGGRNGIRRDGGEEGERQRERLAERGVVLPGV